MTKYRFINMFRKTKRIRRGGNDYLRFTVTVTMKDRWVPHFLATLKYMQYLGGIGSSRMVSLYSDGDGDFRPQFRWNSRLPSQVDPRSDHNGDRVYDAG